MRKKLDGSFIKLFSPLDWVTILYMLFSGIYICFSTLNIYELLPHIIIRITIFIIIICLCILKDKLGTNKIILFLTNLYPLLFLGFFYTETFYMKNILFATNFDSFFYDLEHTLWYCQPSIEFSKLYSQNWFNELMNMFYFSYYLLIASCCIVLYLKAKKDSQKAIFTIFCSFYLYYLFFALFPVVGPKFHILDADNSTSQPYFFGKLIHYILTDFEKPTGAFPSSHVGIAIIIAYISFRHLKTYFYITLPFVLGICFATVYIKAHYLVDVIAGIISAPLCIIISYKIYNKLLTFNTKLQFGATS